MRENKQVNIFTKPLDTVTFEDIESYCAEKKPETAQLDYKKSMPKDGLAKHIAAMSNTLGGIILIGIEEDSTGHPAKWEGVPNDSKLIDQVYQQAANIKPYPNCHVYQTTEKNGKVFILVQILEGSAGPYVTVTDPHIVWMRTGNISTPLKRADQDATERIRDKRDTAIATQHQNDAYASQMYKTLLSEAEKEREELIKSDPVRNKHLVDQPVADNVVLLELVLQPYSPTPGLLGDKPADIKGRLTEFQGQYHNAHFPTLNYNTPAPNGGLTAFYGWGGIGFAICCDQFYTNGLIYHAHDVLAPRPKDQPPTIWLSHILMELFGFFEVAKKAYNVFGYHGLLVGTIRLTGAKGCTINHISQNTLHWPSELRQHQAIQDSYSWPLNLDTGKLNDPDWRLTNLHALMETLYWELGRYTDFSPDEVTQFLTKSGFIRP